MVTDDVGINSFKYDWECTLRRIEKKGVVLSTTESILFDVFKDAKDPNFKKILKIIKMKRTKLFSKFWKYLYLFKKI